MTGHDIEGLIILGMLLLFALLAMLIDAWRDHHG